jgi:FMNH2-dependent dimethyl sulfone monooxygenase
MDASWEYSRDLAIRAEQIGFDLTLVAELNLNDIKGEDAPALDAWSTAAALAAVTKTQEIMVAVVRRSTRPRSLPSRPRTSTGSATGGCH